MTNAEYYKDDILKFTKSEQHGFAFTGSAITSCRETPCEKCIFSTDEISCKNAEAKWLVEEHIKGESLKACPFCGKKAAELGTLDEYEGCFDHMQYSVICSAWNGGCGSSTGWRDTEEEAIELWNRRAEVDQHVLQ